MTRFLILSDTHGRIGRAADILERNRGRLQGVIHLGDYAQDAERLRQAAPELPFYMVSGNNDRPVIAPEQRVLCREGVTMFLTHGHRYRVDEREDLLGYAAAEAGATLALFGHIHLPMWETIGAVTYLNPGSLSLPHNPQGPTFATLELETGAPPKACLWIYRPEGQSKVLQ